MHAGEWVAVVGLSGAGKTTLARCLTGALKPSEGSVLVEGVAPSALDEDEHSRRIVMVSQDVHVCSGTLRDNLAIARDSAADTQRCEALHTVSGADAPPADLDRLVGDGHATVNALEAHRLSQARDADRVIVLA